MTLLTRTQFNEAALQRDGHKCVCCGRGLSDGVRLDVHHILDRALFTDGGYYINNAATLCDDGTRDGCHYKAEAAQLSVEDIRSAAGIVEIILPDYLDTADKYDKWGNVVLPNGQRMAGPMFDLPNVRKVLQAALADFTPYVKYPRTFHAPWPEGLTAAGRFLN